MALSRDETWVASASHACDLVVVFTEEHASLGPTNIDLPERLWVDKAFFCLGDTSVVWGTFRGPLWLADWRRAGPARRLGEAGSWTFVDGVPTDDRVALVITGSQDVELWRLDGKPVARTTLLVNRRPLASAKLLAGGQTLMTRGTDGHVELSDLMSEPPRRQLLRPALDRGGYDSAFASVSASGRLMAAASDAEEEVCIWDVSGWPARPIGGLDCPSAASSATFSGGEEHLVVAGTGLEDCAPFVAIKRCSG